jgi:hypothetical protein
MAMRILPDIELETQSGERAGTAEVLQRQEVVLALLHSDCPPCARLLETLAARHADFLGRRTAVRILGPPTLPGSTDRLAWLPFPLLVDGEGVAGRTLRTVLGLEDERAFVLTADRFGRLYSRLDVHAHPPEWVVGEALSWLDFIQMQCPECGVPEHPGA